MSLFIGVFNTFAAIAELSCPSVACFIEIGVAANVLSK